MLALTINGIDRTNKIVLGSLRIENVLTKEIDKCSFTIRKKQAGDYIPVIGREVVITDNSVKVFAGVIVRVMHNSVGFPLVDYICECIDYSRVLDQHLVSETYENKTVAEIIADIITNWAPSGFTTVQVDCDVLINYIQFKYEPVTDCFRQLAEIVGFDWYVDYDKDIYFKSPTATDASIDITDSGGTYQKGSLMVRKDNTQLRTSIIVRGGEYLGTEFTASERFDGRQIVMNLPYKYTDFKATLTGNILNIGRDYLDDPDDYDALYNFNEKLIRFKDVDKPSKDATLSFAGKPHLPVIVKLKDQARINTIFSSEGLGDGKYEHLIIDKAINTKAGARERAMAELRSYGDTLSQGNFITETSGLRAGQRILVNSTSFGINEYFIINRVVSVMKTYDTLRYQVSLITTKTFDFIALLKKILLGERKKIEIKKDEVLDLVESTEETITVNETLTSSLEHNLQTETITVNEVFTAQSLNFGTEFNLAPFTPIGTKREFHLDGSPLS